MLSRSTIQLLRFHFSFFLMPVYWLALSQVQNIDYSNAIIVFIILHLLVYPSSNGYNSYMDRDSGSIGGVKDPLPPTKQLFYTTVFMDLISIVWSYFISPIFLIGILLYIIASRAYSYRGIRLKKYPLWSYLTVIIFQGAMVFFLTMHGSSQTKTLDIPLIGMIAASLMVGSFYPLTQIYQHMQDKADGVTSLSYFLGYRGTFIFSAVIYLLAMIALAIYLLLNSELMQFYIIQIFFLPVLIYFLVWFNKVYHNEQEANFTNTMRMNLLASFFTNAAFIYLFISQKF